MDEIDITRFCLISSFFRKYKNRWIKCENGTVRDEIGFNASFCDSSRSRQAGASWCGRCSSHRERSLDGFSPSLDCSPPFMSHSLLRGSRCLLFLLRCPTIDELGCFSKVGCALKPSSTVASWTTSPNIVVRLGDTVLFAGDFFSHTTRRGTLRARARCLPSHFLSPPRLWKSPKRLCSLAGQPGGFFAERVFRARRSVPRSSSSPPFFTFLR